MPGVGDPLVPAAPVLAGSGGSVGSLVEFIVVRPVDAPDPGLGLELGAVPADVLAEGAGLPVELVGVTPLAAVESPLLADPSPPPVGVGEAIGVAGATPVGPVVPVVPVVAAALGDDVAPVPPV